MAMRPHILAASMLLVIFCIHSASPETLPLAAVTGYRFPSIFALNDGKPFYLDKDPITGEIHFNPGERKESTDAVAEESSPVADEATAADEYDEEEDEKSAPHPAPAAADDSSRRTPPKPLKAAPVVEEIDEDEPPPPQSKPSSLAPIPKDQIDRKDTASNLKTTGGGRPNDIHDGSDNNPFFHQFLNLNVHEYGDRIPGASSVRDDPYSFGNLNAGSSPFEREYKFPLISSSYANTKVQGVGGNYYYGDKGNDKDKNKDKYKPGYTGGYTTSSTRRPAPSYYHDSGKDEEDEYYGKPSSTSSASDAEEDEEEDYHKYAGSSHHQGNRDGAEEGADEEEEEEGDESIDELVEEVSDYNRPPAPPKPPVTPSSQPPKETSPSNQQQHHYHHQGDEADDEASDDYDDERPLHSNSGGGGYGNRPAADNQRPQTQQTYYYGSPAYEEEEEEEEQNEGPQRRPENFQGAHRGEEDRPRPSQAHEEAEEEGGEEEESTVKEKPSSLPPKPTLSYLGFSSDYDAGHHGSFGEKLQGSQNVEKPTKENPGYKYGYSGPPHEFSVDGFFSSDVEGPPSKPSKEPETVDSTSGDKKAQPSNKNEDKDEKQETVEDNTENVYDNRRPYNPPQGVRFTQPPPSQLPTQRPTILQSQQTAAPPPNLNQGTYHKPLYQSPYGIEEPFRPIYGPGDDERETYVRPVQSYQHPNKNQQVQYLARPSSNPPIRVTPSPDPRPSGGQQYDSYYPLRPLNVNVLPQNKKEVTPESTPKEPITSTYKPYYDSKTKKPIEQASSSWKVDPVNNANGGPPPRPIQEDSKETAVQKEHSKPTTSSQDPVSKYPPTLPPPPPPHREVVGIGSVGEPEFVKPTKQPSYGPFRFPDHDYSQQRPILQPQNGQNFIQRPSANNPATAKPILPPPPFGLPPQTGPQRPILPPSQNIRPQLLDNHPPPPYRPQRPPVLGGGPPLQPPPRRWEERPVHLHSNVHPASQNFPPHRPPPRSQDQPLNGPPSPANGHPYKFVSRKPGQEPVLMGSAPNAVFGNGFNANNKKIPPPNGPKAQVPDPNLPNILPQFRPNAKVSYSTIQREKGPYSPPPPPPPFGPNQRISNGPERRIISPFYDHLQPPPPPNRLHRIQGNEPEIPYGPPQIYPFGPGGSPPVGRRSGQHHLARVGEENIESGSESQEEIRKRPQVTTLQMMRNGLMEHQSSRHPAVSKEDSVPKSTANPPPIQVNPTIYVTPDEGSTSASLSVDSSASEDHPVFVVYPVSDSSFRDDGVVIGTRGSQRPLPPSSIAAETAPSVLPQRTNSVLSDFPYPLVKPSEVLPTIPSNPDSSILGPVYSLVQEEGPDGNRKDNTESNIIPYLQDYSPYATRKPVTAQNLEPTISTTAEPSSTTTSSPSTTTSTTEKSMAKSPVSIVNAWQPDSEVEVSATMHTGGNPGLPVNHRPLIEDKKEPSTPPSLNFQAPFHASENIVPSPDSGWSAVGGSTSTVLPSEGSQTISRVDYNSPSDMNSNDGDSSDTSKFDFDNFKPQLFGGFKPIYSLPGEEEGEFKYALGTTERQER